MRNIRLPFFLACLGTIVGCTTEAEPMARITVDPHCTRQIGGIAELERAHYFGLCDPGTDFDRRCRDDERFDFLVRELGIRFGRKLGPVKGVVKGVEEDPERPGHVALDPLRKRLADRTRPPGDLMRKAFGSNLDVAAHGNHNAYPDFMGLHNNELALAEEHPDSLPANLDAAVELAVAVFQHGYTDFDRPAFYEPINEPHWSYFGDLHLAEWHLKLLDAFHQQVPGTQVGGLCMSVAYMYDHDYQTWNGFRTFIDNTRGELDFYSFHAYDYLTFEDGDFVGRVQSGLPLEGVLDLISNYTVNQYDREVPIVVSEQGGYVTGKDGMTAGEIAAEIATRQFPGEGFEWELKKRSIMEFNHVSSIIANTLNFMDHPHTVKKAVPFILLESFNWDPHYYSTLYTMHDFTDRSRWVESRNLDFYRFFRGVQGRRVTAFCDDPDIQTRAFVDDNKLYIVVNNLWTAPQPVRLDIPAAPSISVRRLGRNQDFTPTYVEQQLDSLDGLALAGREAMLITAAYGEPIEMNRQVNEIPCYGDRVVVPVTDAVRISIPVAEPGTMEYAELRIGLRRPAGSDKAITVLFNGRPVEVPIEDCAPRLEQSEGDYATTRLVRIPPTWIENQNTVTISFPDGNEGTIGSVVLRAAVTVSP